MTTAALIAAAFLPTWGFNEGRIPQATREDIRYTASKDGKTVYAIALVPPPEGGKPVCGELEKAGIALGERLTQVKDFPAVWKCHAMPGK